jgi:sugar phosphate isomerase/epimerase
MTNEPRYAVNEWSTPHNTVLQDVDQIARTGGQAIGLFGGKFVAGEEQRYQEAMLQSGLAASYCVPTVWTILPTPFNVPGIPSDPQARTDLICQGMEQLAPFKPMAFIVGPGVSGDATQPLEVSKALADGLAQVADVAAGLGVPVAFELLAARRGSPLPWLPDIVRFIDDVGKPNVGVLFDMWHSWPEQDLHAHIQQYADRILGVHVNDVRFEERSNFDRAYPGDERGVAPAMCASLIQAGYQGWYELEIFSDDGTYGSDFPDSFWKIPHREMLSTAKAKFDQVWAQAQQLVASSAPATPPAQGSPR